MKKLLLVFFFLSEMAFAQFKNNVWCFGDSCGIKFNQGSTQIFTSSSLTRGGSCSISDSAGNLLFYATTHYFPLWQQGYLKLGVVFDKNNNLMQNGDTLMGSLLYQEQVIIPFPSTDSLFYIFNVGVAFPYGLYFSVIDINQNSGLGVVVQKNIQINNFKANDCIAAVKHGNGRDWWLLFRRWDSVNNSYYKYLITPAGVSSPIIQNIGTQTDNGFMHSSFSKDGSKYLITDARGLIEIYNFNRCSGILDSAITIEPEVMSSYPNYFGCEFSASGRYIYVSSNNDTDSYIFQYDLQAANITLSKTTVAYLTLPSTGGLIKRAPDDKIYFSCVYKDSSNPIYPYPDSVSNLFNENLSVINYPDSPGVACGFAPFSFYLGGNETYWGLPNNPNYGLGPLAGSACDTLTSPTPALPGGEGVPTLFTFYHPLWQMLFVNAQHIKGKNCLLQIFDLTGKIIYSNVSGRSPSGVGGSAGGYFTQDINCAAFAKGMYVVSLQTEKEKLVKKFVIQ